MLAGRLCCVASADSGSAARHAVHTATSDPLLCTCPPLLPAGYPLLCTTYYPLLRAGYPLLRAVQWWWTLIKQNNENKIKPCA